MLNLNIISFKNGGLWRHNENTIYNIFYGIGNSSKLEVYCNEYESNVKVFEAIAQESKHAWNVTVETPVTIQNPFGQHTELYSSNFEMREGFFYSEILKDDYTPNIVAGQSFLPNARFEGNPMRAPYALIKLEYVGIANTRMYAINVHIISSDRHNM